MGFQLIQDKLNERVSKKQFLKETGWLLLVVMIAPTLLTKILNKSRIKMIGNQIFLDDNLIIDRRED